MLRKIIAVASMATLLASCQQPQDVMSGGGDIDEVQQTADTRKALASGDASVCADTLLHQTVLAIINDNVDMAFSHATLRQFYANEVQSVLSGTDSYLRGFDGVTKAMRCETTMISLFRGETYETPVFWSVQPTADGSDMNVTVDFDSFHSRRLDLAMAMWRADQADQAKAPPSSPEPLVFDETAAAAAAAAPAPAF